MFFDEKMMGIINMLGALNGGQEKTDKSNIPQSSFDMSKLMGMMSLLQGLNKTGQNSAGFGQITGDQGVDVAKLLPLISMLKGGNPLNNFSATTTEKVEKQSAEVLSEENVKENKKGGYKGKYSAVSFAGNEVIYNLGKLWKIKRQD